MIDYRRTRPSDRIQIADMLKHSKLEYDGREPLIGFVAESQPDGKLIGVSYAHQAAIIEPFICKNPLSAMKLFYMTEGALSALGLQTVVVQVGDASLNLQKELPMLGFEKVESKFWIFKKVSRV